MIPSPILRDSSIRLLDTGGIEVIGGVPEYYGGGKKIPVNPIFSDQTQKWYFETPAQMSWYDAQAWFTNYNANLVTIRQYNNFDEGRWLVQQFTDAEAHWIGYYIQYVNFGNQIVAWAWVSGANSGWENWADGVDPRHGPSLTIESAVVQLPWGQWGVAMRGYGWYGIGDISASSVTTYTNNWRLTEPLATSRLIGLVKGLLCSFLSPDQTNAASIFYAFADDQNLSGTLDGGDSLVVAGYQVSNNTWTNNWLARIPIDTSSVTIAQSYAMALANLIPLQPNILFTGEPDGRVFAWVATNNAAPLQRQLFNASYTGKAWHSLAPAALGEAGQALAGALVDPSEPSKCNIVLWHPRPVLNLPPDVTETAPLTSILPNSGFTGAFGVIKVLIMDAEGNNSWPELQFQIAGSGVWSNTTLLSINGIAPTNFVSALPSGSSHTLLWDAGHQLGPATNNTILLRARSTDVALTGDWSASFSLQGSVSSGLPVAIDDIATTHQNVSTNINVLANDLSPNHLILRIANINQGAHGQVATNTDSTLRYSPNANFIGQEILPIPPLTAPGAPAPPWFTYP